MAAGSEVVNDGTAEVASASVDPGGSETEVASASVDPADVNSASVDPEPQSREDWIIELNTELTMATRHKKSCPSEMDLSLPL